MIIVDTREKEQAITHILFQFRETNTDYIIKKLDYGDYYNTDNPNVVVDRKYGIVEIAKNICSEDHKRLINEIELCNQNHCKMIFLITDENVKTLDDLEKWNSNPKDFKKNHTQVKGSTLVKAMRTMIEKYGVEFRFARLGDYGRTLLDILNYYGKEQKMYIQGDYLYFELDKPPKKITGTKFAPLVDKNPYTKKGDQMLEILGLLPHPYVDPYYAYRGEITEKIVKQLFERNGKQCQTWDKQDVNFDNFPDEVVFGGLIDIYLPQEHTVIEVKSKSLRKRFDIEHNGSEYEFLQGALYSNLLQANKLIMCWVFYNAETETLMHDHQPFDLHGKNSKGEPNVSFLIKQWELKDFYEQVQVLKNQAESYYNKVIFEKRIALSDISNSTIKTLKDKGEL